MTRQTSCLAMEIFVTLENFDEEIDHRSKAYIEATNYLSSMAFKGKLDEDSNNVVGLDPSTLQVVNGVD